MRSCDGHDAVCQGYHRANWPSPKDPFFTDPRSLPSRMIEANIVLPILDFPAFLAFSPC